MKETYEQRKARLTAVLKREKARDDVADFRKAAIREGGTLLAADVEKLAIVIEWGEDNPPLEFLALLGAKER